MDQRSGEEEVDQWSGEEVDQWSREGGPLPEKMKKRREHECQFYSAS